MRRHAKGRRCRRPCSRDGAPCRIRTNDLGIRSPLLYPAELMAQNMAIIVDAGRLSTRFEREMPNYPSAPPLQRRAPGGSAPRRCRSPAGFLLRDRASPHRGRRMPAPCVLTDLRIMGIWKPGSRVVCWRIRCLVGGAWKHRVRAPGCWGRAHGSSGRSRCFG